MKQLTFKIVGIAPMLMHSDKTADPFNAYTKQMKVLTSKRKKTDEDLMEIARIEWEASLYYEAGIGYFMPAANIEANLLASAKMFKQGTLLKQACIVPDDATFEFKHSKLTPVSLYERTEYIDRRTVKIGTAKTIRCRPIFREWECMFTIMLDENKLNESDILQIVENAGKYVGLGDYRPRYGRYEIKEMK